MVAEKIKSCPNRQFGNFVIFVIQIARPGRSGRICAWPILHAWPFARPIPIGQPRQYAAAQSLGHPRMASWLVRADVVQIIRNPNPARSTRPSGLNYRNYKAVKIGRFGTLTSGRARMREIDHLAWAQSPQAGVANGPSRSK